MSRGCATCTHADLPRTPSGKIARSQGTRGGQCLCPVTLPPLPDSMTHYFRFTPDLPRSAIWPEDGAKCPTWAPIPRPSREP